MVGDRHEIVVLDPRPDFTFIPSLIWLPFGLRDAEDVTFPLAPMYAKKGIRFINEAATNIDPAAHTVTTSSGQELRYDRLFIGTGPRLAFEKVPGLGPEDGYTQSVCNLDHALLARAEWERFLQNPGPVDDEYRHPEHRDIFAAGVAIAIAPPAPIPVPAGVPKTGQMEAMAKVAAHNIAADINERPDDGRPAGPPGQDRVRAHLHRVPQARDARPLKPLPSPRHDKES